MMPAMSIGHTPESVKLGDLTVHRMGFGAMQLPGPNVWGEPKDPARARAVLTKVVELGIDLIDTSWYYGPHVANRLIAETLHPYAKNLVIATKLGGRRTDDGGWAPFIRPEELRKGCEEDLQTLKRDVIDVTQLRWMSGAGVTFAEALDGMLTLKSEGKIRHIGLSNVTLVELEQALVKTPIVSVQNLYNVAQGERRLAGLPHMLVADQERMVDMCAEKQIAFMPFFPLAIPGPNKVGAPAVEAVAKKRNVTPPQIALAWLLARSPSMLPIPGTSSPEHLVENWEARDIVLTKEEIAAISDARA